MRGGLFQTGGLLRQIEAGNVGTRLGQANSQALADATAGAGDEGNLALQREQIHGVSPWCRVAAARSGGCRSQGSASMRCPVFRSVIKVLSQPPRSAPRIASNLRRPPATPMRRRARRIWSVEMPITRLSKSVST